MIAPDFLKLVSCLYFVHWEVKGLTSQSHFPLAGQPLYNSGLLFPDNQRLIYLMSGGNDIGNQKGYTKDYVEY